MIKEVKLQTLMPTSRDLIMNELREQWDEAVSLGETFLSRFELTPKQKEIEQIIEESQIGHDETLFILLYGTPGSAKTWGAIGIILKKILQYAGLKCIFSRRTYQQIEDTLWPETIGFLDSYDIRYKSYKKNLELQLGNSSFIRMRSSERTATQKTNKAHGLGGTQYKIGFIEEVDECPEEFFMTLPSRMRQRVAGLPFGIIFAACNPPSEDSWVHKFWFEDPDNDPHDPRSCKRVLQMNVQDNPYATEGYIKNLFRAYKNDPLLFNAFCKGEFTPNMKGDPIFTQSFKKEIHVAPNSLHSNWDRSLPIWVTCDFGYNRPAIAAGQDFTNLGQNRIYCEKLGHKELLRPFVRKFMNSLEKKFPGARYEFYCDPAGDQADSRGVTAETAVDVLREMGYNPKFKKSSVIYGLNLIQQALTDLMPSRFGPVPGLLISPECTQIIKAFLYGYCNEKDVTGGVLRPLKDGIYDHLMDIIRYVMIHIRGRGKGKRDDDFQQTQGGVWTPVASGDPDQWSKEFRALHGVRYAADLYDQRGRPLSVGRAPSTFKENIW